MILIAEDDKHVQKAYARILEDYEIRIFDDAADAVEAMKAGFSPDVIISDVDMPRMIGMSFCNIVRAMNLTTPFMLVSGKGDVEQLAKVCGADAWAMKGGSDLVSKITDFVKAHIKDKSHDG